MHLKALDSSEEGAPSDVVRRLQAASRQALDASYNPISKVASRYLDERRPHVIASTAGHLELTLDRFRAHLKGDPSIEEVGRKEAGDYVSHLLANGKSLKTNRDAVSALKTFFSWATRRGLYDLANPFEGFSADFRSSRRGTSDNGQRRPWTPEEYGKLQLLDPDDLMHPLCMIALKSGMRRNEIAELKREDVNLEERFMVVTEGKTDNAVRQVPIHAELEGVLRVWLQKAEKANSEYLLPGLKRAGRDKKRGHLLGKRVGRWIRANVSKDRGLVLHSLRNTFMARAESAGVPEPTTALIVGHARQSLTYGLYSKGPGFEALLEAVDKVSF